MQSMCQIVQQYLGEILKFKFLRLSGYSCVSGERYLNVKVETLMSGRFKPGDGDWICGDPK